MIPRNFSPFARASAAALAAALTLGSASARAEGNGVTLDAYRAAELATDGFAVPRPITLREGSYGARLTLDYALRPLTLDAPGSGFDYQVVSHQLMGTASIAFALHERVTLAVGIPLSLTMRGETPPSSTLPGVDGRLAGDPYLAARVRILGDEGDRFVLGAQMKVTFPLANAASHLELWSGDESLTLQPTLLGEIAVSRDLRVNVAVGGRFRRVARQPFLTVGQELTFAAALSYRIVPQFLDITAEAYGSTDLGILAGNSNSPLEVIAGVRVHPTDQWHLGIALGTAASGGYGASDFRGVVTVGFAQIPTVPLDDLDGPDGDSDIFEDELEAPAPSDSDAEGVATDEATETPAGDSVEDPAHPADAQDVPPDETPPLVDE